VAALTQYEGAFVRAADEDEGSGHDWEPSGAAEVLAWLRAREVE
tara:strand:+ start:439 stop:570 length:132 start_codon:yes stop_codon:yes gene_type:complete